MPFAIPLQSDVVQHVVEKKPEWPREFAEYYAHKFWNHYQAQGWKLSNGNAMKDWKAAFNANWQTLKFKEDIDSLAVAQAKHVKTAASNTNDMESFIDNLVRQQSLGNYERRVDVLIRVYDWLKKTNRAKLPRNVIEHIYANAGNNRDMAKCMSVHAWADAQIKRRNV